MDNISVNVIATDYGEVVVGPKFLAYLLEVCPEYPKLPRRRTKRRARYDRMIEHISHIAAFCWALEVDFERTP